MEPEPIPTPSTLPIISDEVKNSLLADLNLDIDATSRRIVAGISGEEPDSPANRARVLVRDVFSDLLASKPSFATGVLTTLKGIDEFYRWRIDNFTMGMAVVISAFDKMSDQSLIERFGRLTEEDVAGVLNMTKDGASLSSDRVSILEQVIQGPRMPDQQINLNQIVNRLAKQLVSESQYMRVGAAVMYQILSKNWPKLAGQNSSPQTSLE